VVSSLTAYFLIILYLSLVLSVSIQLVFVCSQSFCISFTCFVAILVDLWNILDSLVFVLFFFSGFVRVCISFWLLCIHLILIVLLLCLVFISCCLFCKCLLWFSVCFPYFLYPFDYFICYLIFIWLLCMYFSVILFLLLFIFASCWLILVFFSPYFLSFWVFCLSYSCLCLF